MVVSAVSSAFAPIVGSAAAARLTASRYAAIRLVLFFISGLPFLFIFYMVSHTFLSVSLLRFYQITLYQSQIKYIDLPIAV